MSDELSDSVQTGCQSTWPCEEVGKYRYGLESGSNLNGRIEVAVNRYGHYSN